MNNFNIKKKLNVFKILLHGVNLIESSAGTGKTFTIVILYLRLLLGIGEKENIRKLFVHEILVVTFTNAAKEELYVRIKNGIKNLYLACVNKTSTDPFFLLFLKKIKNIDEAICILKKAQNDISNSSIYTIHSFCQNILQLHSIYLNSIIKNKIIENTDNLYLQATQDFWRRCFYKLPEDIINIIYQYYNNPESLLKTIKPLFHIKSLNLKNKSLNNQTLNVYHKKNIEKINNFKKIWLKYDQEILEKINSLKINKRIYNKFHLNKWITNITKWAKSDTIDYSIPISLKYFTKKNIEKNTKNKSNLENVIFKESEKILKFNFSLKNIIILYAVKKINTFILTAKKKKSLLEFDDLVNILLKEIKKEKYLRDLIRKNYPAAFIDEFQDTDIQQYKMFNLIYNKEHKKTVLFLIGDPKQAIYSFRGADIFSYLYAKSNIKKHFYLDTNWRSSINMCKSINYLFFQNKNPFIFKDIPFTSILPSYENSKMNFIVNGVSQSPIRFFLKKQKEVDIDDYQIWIAKQCANEISYWLTCAKIEKAKITIKNGEKNLTSNDIAVLVRNKKEADLIQKELQKLNITSIYSSHKNSIFKNIDAKELLWILKSILEPDNEKLLQQSISTHILKKLVVIAKKKSKNKNSYFIIEKLYEYHNLWKETNIFHMIETMILEYQTNSNSRETNFFYKKNLNFLHIAELLQEKFEQLYTNQQLIHWFQKKIMQKEQLIYSERIRYIHESNAVKIITIHKSKGLEYPIVWIPFSINFNESKLSIYHNKKNFKIFFNVKESNYSLKKSDEERLAEDIRFLYVALTRSILHCSIGIACLIKKRKKNRDNSDIHKSGLGYILQNGKKMNYMNLFHQLNKLSMNNFIEITHHVNSFKLPTNDKNIYLIPKPNCIKKNIKNTWNITSFTNLKQKDTTIIKNKREFLFKKSSINNKNLTIYSFPKGKKTGLLIHEILKNLHFLNKKDYNWFSNILEKYNIPLKWITVLISWTNNIINTSLSNQNIILSKIKEQSCIKEFHFFLPINKTLYDNELNQIMQSVDPISIISPKLIFNPITGILQGYIDLFFYWKKKYYIIDYKSNWLGKNNSFYSVDNIKKEMIKQRYDLQYQIYTIAIHKYLQKKLKNYNYKKDFGGVFYFFVRAISNKNKNYGIFHTIPDYSLVEKIIDLIS